ncbi:MAG: HAD-IC family P-type ATPase, partial [Burkholderiales bacterium]|nr:HAD-IC family P-type ATPase [Burkholderiales bacterium]
MSAAAPPRTAFDTAVLRPALWRAITRLAPQVQWRNPVMFVTWVAAIVVSGVAVTAAVAPERADAPPGFAFACAAWLWFTVLFANFAEAIAEGRSAAQAASLRGLRTETWARKLHAPRHDADWTMTPGADLRAGDIVRVDAGETIPVDGEVVEGVASVDESAITGESAPVIRESGGDFSAVTGGTRVLSDWIVVRVTAEPGHTFLDRMIGMVEGAARGRTPNETALTILLAALTIVFLVACATLQPFSAWATTAAADAGRPVGVTVLAVLLVCLIPTTIGGLLSAVGVAGMSRMLAANVVATSGRAVEAAGDVDVLLL